ncbi:hypothetical protein FRC02_006377, partial [Tulasnella sp. 418]
LIIRATTTRDSNSFYLCPKSNFLNSGPENACRRTRREEAYQESLENGGGVEMQSTVVRKGMGGWWQ